MVGDRMNSNQNISGVFFDQALTKPKFSGQGMRWKDKKEKNRNKEASHTKHQSGKIAQPSQSLRVNTTDAFELLGVIPKGLVHGKLRLPR
jgi:hypothetical protein